MRVFKKTKSAGEIVNSIPLRWCRAFRGHKWIGFGSEGSYRMAVSFLILTRVNIDDGDHWLISVRGTIGREPREDPIVSRSFFISLSSARDWKKPVLSHICNFQKMGAATYATCFLLNVFKSDTDSTKCSQSPNCILSIELHYSPYPTLQSYSVLGCQTSGVWSSGMDL